MTISGTPRAKWGAAKPGRLAAVCIGAIQHRVARGLLKKLVRRILLRFGDTYDIETDGLRVRCHVRDNSVERSFLERGLSGTPILSLITSGLQPGDVFVDIGANCGLFALAAAQKVGPHGRVIAVEPVPAMIDRLRFNIAANNIANIEVVEAAVGEEAGTATLHVDLVQFGHSCVSPMEGYQPTAVPMIPLKEIVRDSKISRIDALKIDIEGHEDRALLPYLSTAPRALWPRRIMMETLLAERWQRDCVEELIKIGYRPTWRSRQDILLEL